MPCFDLIFSVLGLSAGSFAGAGGLLGASVALIFGFVFCMFVCFLSFSTVLGVSGGRFAGAGGLLGASGQGWSGLGP